VTYLDEVVRVRMPMVRARFMPKEFLALRKVRVTAGTVDFDVEIDVTEGPGCLRRDEAVVSLPTVRGEDDRDRGLGLHRRRRLPEVLAMAQTHSARGGAAHEDRRHIYLFNGLATTA
jgi:hypothetical protein